MGFWDNPWDNFTSSIENAIDYVAEGEMLDDLGDVADSAKETLQSGVDYVAEGEMLDDLGDVADSAKETLQSGVDYVADGEMLDDISDVVDSTKETLQSGVDYVADGEMLDDISDVVDSTKETLQTGVDYVADSELMADIGDVVDGTKETFQTGVDYVADGEMLDDIGDVVESTKETLQTGVDYVADSEIMADIGDVVESTKETIQTGVDYVADVAHRGHVVMQGIETGITGLAGDVVGIVAGGAGLVVDGADLLGEKTGWYDIEDPESGGLRGANYFLATSDFIGGGLQDGLDAVQSNCTFGLIGTPDIKDETDETILRWANTTTEVATLIVPGLNVAKAATWGTKATIWGARGFALDATYDTALEEIGIGADTGLLTAEDGSLLSSDGYREAYNDLSQSERDGLYEPSRYERNHGRITEIHEESMTTAQTPVENVVHATDLQTQTLQADEMTAPETTDAENAASATELQAQTLQADEMAAPETTAIENVAPETGIQTQTLPADEIAAPETAATDQTVSTTLAPRQSNQDRRAFASLFAKDADELTTLEIRREFTNATNAIESGELALNGFEGFMFDLYSGISGFFNMIGLHGFADDLKQRALALVEDDVETQFGDEFNMQGATLASGTPAPATAQQV